MWDPTLEGLSEGSSFRVVEFKMADMFLLEAGHSSDSNTR
jgi:hypothetical protein